MSGMLCGCSKTTALLQPNSRAAFRIWNPIPRTFSAIYYTRNNFEGKPKMDKCSDATFLEILNQNSVPKFYIEYRGFYSNHLSHGVTALHRLGASEQRLQQFIKWYSPKLESLQGSTAKKQITEIKDPQSLLGARKDYMFLLNYYTQKFQKEYGSNIEELIRGEFCQLAPGLIGSAIHGLIHLGYGFAAESSRNVCEGLAYLHHSNVPLKTRTKGIVIGNGENDIVDVVNAIRQNTELIDCMKKEFEKVKLGDWDTSDFQRKAFVLFEHKGEELLNYAAQVKTPLESASTCSLQDAVDLCKWLLDCVLYVYTVAESRNDFFILHGVTSTWSLCQILPALKDSKAALEVIQIHICAIFAAYLAQGGSPLTETINPEIFKYKTWDEIIPETLKRDCDEHIYKLVQVAHDRYLDNQDPEKDKIYRGAANVALNHDFTF